MIIQTVYNQLVGSVNAAEPITECEYVINSWEVKNVNVDYVETVLKVIEEHEDIDIGSPGPLVHFVEKFFGKGYEKLLVASLMRHPTMYTVWMMNRVINGTKVNAEKNYYISILKEVECKNCSKEVINLSQHFIGIHSSAEK